MSEIYGRFLLICKEEVRGIKMHMLFVIEYLLWKRREEKCKMQNIQFINEGMNEIRKKGRKKRNKEGINE